MRRRLTRARPSGSVGSSAAKRATVFQVLQAAFKVWQCQSELLLVFQVTCTVRSVDRVTFAYESGSCNTQGRLKSNVILVIHHDGCAINYLLSSQYRSVFEAARVKSYWGNRTAFHSPKRLLSIGVKCPTVLCASMHAHILKDRNSQ